jgi:hypothetical protein
MNRLALGQEELPAALVTPDHPPRPEDARTTPTKIAAAIEIRAVTFRNGENKFDAHKGHSALNAAC